MTRREGEPLRRQRGRACPPQGSGDAVPRQGARSSERAGRRYSRVNIRGKHRDTFTHNRLRLSVDKSYQIPGAVAAPFFDKFAKRPTCQKIHRPVFNKLKKLQ